MAKITKKFEHNKMEECKLCKKEINTLKDEWVALIDYNGKKQVSIGFNHRKCLKDLFEGKGEVIKQRFEEKLGEFVKKMFGGANLENTQFGMNIKQLTST